MKIIFSALALILTTLISCDKEIDPINRQESEYVTLCPIDFVFLDENNGDLIDINDTATYPVAFSDYARHINEIQITRIDSTCVYNGNGNEIYFSDELEKNIWKTIVYGFDNIREHKTYISFNTFKTDTITTKSSFSTDCFGRDYCGTIDEVYYNQTLIYSNGTSESILEPKYVYITKTEINTIVKFD